jgi:hypothetical protein
MSPPLVPQTYFLEDAAELARASLLARLDPTLNFQPFFRLDLGGEIPQAHHASWDYCDMAGRFVDALILTAPMVGANGVSEAEEGLRSFLLDRFNPRDGLAYDAEAPWSTYHADMFCQGRALIGLVTLYLQTGSAAVEEKIEGQIAGLSRIAQWDGDRAFFPKDIWIEDHWEDGGLWNGKAPGYSTQQIVGLARCARATGSPAALRLARGLSLHWQGCGVVAADGTFKGHTHSQGILPTILGVLAYALVAGDEDLALWCQRSYERARRYTSSFGWIPDGLGFDIKETPFAGTCETCALADLIEIAITLTEAGLGDYWDDVDRYARNQLLEQQLRDVSRVTPNADPATAAIIRGAFDSAALANSLIGDRHGLVEGCCTPAGARACLQVWDRIATRDAEGVHINLLFSRDTPWARLISSEPYKGEFRIEVRQAGNFFVRLPDWINEDKVLLSIDGGAPEPLSYAAQDPILEDARPGQVLVLTYPRSDREITDTIAGTEYVTQWKGGTVTRITPTGGRYPTYQRSTLESADPPMIERDPIVRPVVVTW